MTTKLYDYEFRPCRIDGDRRVVASEDAWRQVRALARKNGSARVRVPVDVFEPWDGPMVDAAGREMECLQDVGRQWARHGTGPLLMSDVRFRLFDIVDDYDLTWLLETSHPENVAAMWPSADIFEGETGDDKPAFWPNLWLYAKVDSQTDADARIPHLLDVPAAVRGLVMEPREEINLTECAPYILGDNESNPGVINAFNAMCYHPATCMLAPDVRGTNDGINHVIIRGGAEPMHPDWVRSIIRQCEAAGVPVWFDGWGEFAPEECDAVSMAHDAVLPWHNAAGSDTTPMYRVGVAHSGRVIDGRTWNQLPEVTS